MSKKNKKKPVRKNGRLKKSIYIALQALSGALIVGVLFTYSIMSTMSVSSFSKHYSYNPSINQFRGDYYDSDIFSINFEYAISDILRYSVIRQQLEENGEYEPAKIIKVGSFSHRNDSVAYSGPDAPYYLSDLIKWGERGIERDYKVFFSWEDYYDFIGTNITALPEADLEANNIDSHSIESTSNELESLTEEDVEAEITEDSENEEDSVEITSFYASNDENSYFTFSETISQNGESELIIDDNRSVAQLDTIKNLFLSADMKRLEDYVDNSEEYNELAEALRDTIEDLNTNYTEYKKFNRKFNDKYSNVRYAVIIPQGRSYKLFTNVDDLSFSSSESKVDSTMRNFGHFAYITRGGEYVDSEADIDTEEIKRLITEVYGYSYPYNAKVYVAIDSTYPVKDQFYENYQNFYKVCRAIPWMVLLCAISVILFIALGSWLVMYEKRTLSYEGAKEKLSDFDRLPIEISVLFFLLLILILLIGESLIIKSIDITSIKEKNLYFIPVSALLGIDVYVAMTFFYGFVRRIVCKNVFDGSITSLMIPKVEKVVNKFRRTSQDLYDDSEIVLKIGLGYIMFLIVNVFFMSQVIWGRHAGIFVLLLIIFDFSVEIMIFRLNIERKKIVQGIKRINDGEYTYVIDANKMHGDNKRIAAEVNHIGSSIKSAVEINIKDEKLKADLITNVSHDIKTPLTSIINYVNLLKNENIDNPNAIKYLDILEEKSSRLKQLTLDLVEASKITSGNITLELMKINFVELLLQTIGEFEEKFDEHGLTVITNLPNEPVYIYADPRRMWRIIENLFNNIFKYALENTRVYVDLVVSKDANDNQTMAVSIKNVSKNELNIPADELTERFIRGDVSRSTEGSGLGLSIAKSLTEAHHGKFDIYLDGDLFKVTLTFDILKEENVSKSEEEI